MATETRSAWVRAMEAFPSSRLGAAILSRIGPLIDRPLMKLSGGRVATTAMYPTLLLTTTGRKSGEPRTAPLLFIEHGDDQAIIGTRFGSTSHPAWYLNLQANPEASVLLNGEEFSIRAREANEQERAEIWERATKIYGGFEKYLSRVGDRVIPILILSRKD